MYNNYSDIIQIVSPLLTETGGVATDDLGNTLETSMEVSPTVTRLGSNITTRSSGYKQDDDRLIDEDRIIFTVRRTPFTVKINPNFSLIYNGKTYVIRDVDNITEIQKVMISVIKEV